ncbi:MAG: hypothetical protein SFT92_01685 [Rickettsiales bacterium]|nr:hypothetical protein [Rickettsiales bacterium]
MSQDTDKKVDLSDLVVGEDGVVTYPGIDDPATLPVPQKPVDVNGNTVPGQWYALEGQEWSYMGHNNGKYESRYYDEAKGTFSVDGSYGILHVMSGDIGDGRTFHYVGADNAINRKALLDAGFEEVSRITDINHASVHFDFVDHNVNRAFDHDVANVKYAEHGGNDESRDALRNGLQGMHELTGKLGVKNEDGSLTPIGIEQPGYYHHDKEHGTLLVSTPEGKLYYTDNAARAENALRYLPEVKYGETPIFRPSKTLKIPSFGEKDILPLDEKDKNAQEAAEHIHRNTIYTKGYTHKRIAEERKWATSDLSRSWKAEEGAEKSVKLAKEHIQTAAGGVSLAERELALAQAKVEDAKRRQTSAELEHMARTDDHQTILKRIEAEKAKVNEETGKNTFR